MVVQEESLCLASSVTWDVTISRVFISTGTTQNAGSLIATRDLHQIKPTSLNLSRQAPHFKLVKRNVVVRAQLQSYGTVQRSDCSHSTGCHPQEVPDWCESDPLQADGVHIIACCSPLTEQIFFFIEYSKCIVTLSKTHNHKVICSQGCETAYSVCSSMSEDALIGINIMYWGENTTVFFRKRNNSAEGTFAFSVCTCSDFHSSCTPTVHSSCPLTDAVRLKPGALVWLICTHGCFKW